MRGTWQTTDGGGGSGGLVLAVIAAAVLLGSGVASAIASALVVILIIAAVVVALAVVAGIAWLVYRARKAPRIPAAPVYRVAPGPRPHLGSSAHPAIEPRHELHVHYHYHAADGQQAPAITEGKINHV
jgi:hypothetical protein